jgi:hypothetical protein
MFSNQAISGHNTWSNLVRLVTGDDLFIIDTANDADSAKDKSSLEALIRRLWTANPFARMIFISSPSWSGQDISIDSNVNHPTNEAALNNVSALASYYGIPLVDYWGQLKALVGGGTYHLNEVVSVDTVHPSTLGYSIMATLLEAYLPTGGTVQPSPLPARLYDNGDYENTPTVKLGTAYDNRSGTWADNGTEVSSSTVGSIITYSATCQSFGAYRADGGSNDVQVSIDGGAYADASFYQNGTAIVGGRAAHTIAIKVKSGTVKITQFWAV